MKKIQKLVIVLIIFAAFTLRFYKLGVNPPGLYWDEAVFGYDAYSILKTGRDHHGVTLPLFFESFGDWKLPVYHYLLVPSIKLFGLSEFAVRFPSAFFGSLTIPVFFLLIKRLTQNINLAQFAAFSLAISPWHIQFSRAGFESVPGLFMLTTATFLFLIAQEKKSSLFFLFAFTLFVLSMYSYHAYRIFTPFFVLALLVIYIKRLSGLFKKILIPVLLAFILSLPLLFFTFSNEGRARAISQSAFSKSNYESERIFFDQNSKRPLRFLSKYWSQNLYFSTVALKNYLNQFSPTFLFFRGDSIGRHSQVDMGQLYTFDAILILTGIFALKILNRQTKNLMIVWLLLAPVPAAIVVPTPHAYRALQMALPLAFLSGFGAFHIFNQRKLLFLKLFLVSLVIYSHLTFLHLLFVHYPKKFGPDWQDGYREMVAAVQKQQDSFEKVYVTNLNQVPYIYLLFYLKYDPAKFINAGGTRDTFDKYVFISNEVNVYDKGRILYVAPSWEKVNGRWLAAANDSNGRHIYSLWEVNGQN